MNDLPEPDDEVILCDMCESETDEVVCPYCGWDHNKQEYINEEESGTD